MFENLTEKLDAVFKKLKGRGMLDEETVATAMKSIRMALLEADVNFRVTKEFIEDVSRRAVGRKCSTASPPDSRSSKSSTTDSSS